MESSFVLYLIKVKIIVRSMKRDDTTEQEEKMGRKNISQPLQQLV